MKAIARRLLRGAQPFRRSTCGARLESGRSCPPNRVRYLAAGLRRGSLAARCSRRISLRLEFAGQRTLGPSQSAAWECLAGEAGHYTGLPPGRWRGVTGSWWFARPERRRTDLPRAAVRALVPASLCRPLLLEPAPHDVVAVIW